MKKPPRVAPQGRRLEGPSQLIVIALPVLVVVGLFVLGFVESS